MQLSVASHLLLADSPNVTKRTHSHFEDRVTFGERLTPKQVNKQYFLPVMLEIERVRLVYCRVGGERCCLIFSEPIFFCDSPVWQDKERNGGVHLIVRRWCHSILLYRIVCSRFRSHTILSQTLATNNAMIISFVTVWFVWGKYWFCDMKPLWKIIHPGKGFVA